MKLIEFISQFPDEDACRLKFKEYRQRIGVTCPHCGCTVHYWVGGKTNCFVCKECGFKQTLRSHTVMHHSHLSFRTWFIAMHLLTSTKSAFSTSEIQRQLGLKYYRPVFEMIHKLRNVMSKAEQNTILEGEVEIDEAFFKVEIPSDYIFKHRKDNNEISVVVMAESQECIQNKQKRYSFDKAFGKIRFKVVNSISGVSIREAARECIAHNSVLRGDGTPAHNILRNVFSNVSGEVLASTSEVLRVLPYVHINIGHSKNRFCDIYHGIAATYLQLYLDEFSYKKNRRYERDLFYCLLSDSVRERNSWFAHRFIKEFEIPKALQGIKFF